MKELKFIVKLGVNYYLCESKSGIKYVTLDMATRYENHKDAEIAGMKIPFESFSITIYNLHVRVIFDKIQSPDCDYIQSWNCSSRFGNIIRSECIIFFYQVNHQV